MTLKELLLELNLMIQTGSVAADTQICIPIKEDMEMPQMGSEVEPVSAVSLAILAREDGAQETCLIMINTSRLRKVMGI